MGSLTLVSWAQSTTTVALDTVNSGSAPDDWAEYTTSLTPTNRRSGGGSTITAALYLGAGALSNVTDARSVSWTNGTPTASGTNATTVFNSNFAANNGITFTLPADTSTRTVWLYIGPYNTSQMSITASLSDSSATAINDTTTLKGTTSSLNPGVLILTYAANSASQTLTVNIFTQATAPQTVVLGAVAVAVTGGGGNGLLCIEDPWYWFEDALDDDWQTILDDDDDAVGPNAPISSVTYSDEWIADDEAYDETWLIDHFAQEEDPDNQYGDWPFEYFSEDEVEQFQPDDNYFNSNAAVVPPPIPDDSWYWFEDTLDDDWQTILDDDDDAVGGDNNLLLAVEEPIHDWAAADEDNTWELDVAHALVDFVAPQPTQYYDDGADWQTQDSDDDLWLVLNTELVVVDVIPPVAQTFDDVWNWDEDEEPFDIALYDGSAHIAGSGHAVQDAWDWDEEPQHEDWWINEYQQQDVLPNPDVVGDGITDWFWFDDYADVEDRIDELVGDNSYLVIQAKATSISILHYGTVITIMGGN
jgi:hypothetical protein